MKNRKKLLGNSLIAILITFALLALVMTLNTFGQDLSSNSPSVTGSKTELTTGSWVMSGVKTQVYNRNNITKWETASGEIDANCSWKDILDIVHTVSTGFKWEEPPKTMQPGSFLNIEANYINKEYSTTGKVYTGIRMFIDKVGANYLVMDPEAIEVMKLAKDNKQYNSEVKKGFFSAPKTLFDDTNDCQLIVDCYVGQDHFVTTYTYTYQP
jgi:hypothetical protein